MHESYFAPYTADSRTNGFLMAKVLTTLLVGAMVHRLLPADFV